MSKLKKGALFTDIHFGRRNNAEEHNQDCLNYLTWFCDNVRKDPSIDHIWFLGDWHEHRAAINAFTLQHSYNGAKMLNDLGLPIYFIVGNHDMAARNKRHTFTTEVFESLNNFKLINELEVIEDIHGTALAIPYLVEDEYPELLSHKDVPVALGHLELQGFVLTGETKIKEHGPDYKTFFKNQKRVFSGHFHKRQTQGNVQYIGNCFPMDFSDTNDTKRGMATYDFVSDELEYFDWAEGPRFIRAKLSEVLENPKLILAKGARVKLDVDDDITYDESNKIKETLTKKYGLRELTLDEQMSIDVTLSEDEVAIEELQLETTSQVIQELLRRIKDDSVDTDLLLKIYNGIKSDDVVDVIRAGEVEFIGMTMRNYLSYGNAETSVDLDFTKPTMILGRNYDSIVEGQVDSNGAGKSTILNALLLCLYGKNLINAVLNNQINKANGKNMQLSVTFKAGDTYYKVVRYRKNKSFGGDGVRLYENSEPVFTEDHDKTPDSVGATEQKIANILGIPYDMFIRIVVFSATHEPFLSLPSSHASKANQKDIIEELFGLTELTKKADVLKNQLSESKKSFKLLEEVNSRLEAEHARHSAQVDANVLRLNQWDADKAGRIEAAKQLLEALTGIDLKYSIDGFDELDKLEKKLLKTEKNVPVLQAELKNLVSNSQKSEQWDVTQKSKIAHLVGEIESMSSFDPEALKVKSARLLELTEKHAAHVTNVFNKEREIDTEEMTKGVNDIIISRANGEIEHLNDNKCPYCKQKFADVQAKLAELNQSIQEHETANNLSDSRIVEIKKEIDALNEIHKGYAEEFTELSSQKIPTFYEIQMQEGIRDRLITSLETAKAEINPYVDAESELDPEDIEDMLATIEETAKGIRSKISMAKEFIHPSFSTRADIAAHEIKVQTAQSRVKEIEKEENPFLVVVDSLRAEKLEALKTNEINDLDVLIKHQDFLVKLLTKKDSFIRKALLNKNIPLLNSRLRYYLDRVGLPHKVKFNEEMGVDISQFGSEFEYSLFSSGQKARVNICLAFAFRDVLQTRFGKTNLCILDECLDTGLGAVGVSLVAKMIKSVAVENDLSMFVISHRDEISNMFDRRLEIELRNGFSTILV